ncbi:MAG: hypothetical protein MSG64_10210 [Pyrinomonadaceae bacterium MAG19_C2-C3]|nr:hypothetical protein [Pyrinomonadaceae bacterium MAG19_C2-C3]
MKENTAVAERTYPAPHGEDNRLKIVGGDTTRRHTAEDAALITRLDKLQAIARSFMQEIKSISIAKSNVDVAEGVDFYDEVRRFEADLIRQALVLTDGHQIRAARLLGLGVTTLNSMIKRYGISPHDPARDSRGEADA